jgi:hypothetical protein
VVGDEKTEEKQEGGIPRDRVWKENTTGLRSRSYLVDRNYAAGDVCGVCGVRRERRATTNEPPPRGIRLWGRMHTVPKRGAVSPRGICTTKNHKIPKQSVGEEGLIFARPARHHLFCLFDTHSPSPSLSLTHRHLRMSRATQPRSQLFVFGKADGSIVPLLGARASHPIRLDLALSSSASSSVAGSPSLSVAASTATPAASASSYSPPVSPAASPPLASVPPASVSKTRDRADEQLTSVSTTDSLDLREGVCSAAATESGVLLAESERHSRSGPSNHHEVCTSAERNDHDRRACDYERRVQTPAHPMATAAQSRLLRRERVHPLAALLFDANPADGEVVAAADHTTPTTPPGTEESAARSGGDHALSESDRVRSENSLSESDRTRSEAAPHGPWEEEFDSHIQPIPTVLAAANGVVSASIACGSQHLVCIDPNGDVFSWVGHHALTCVAARFSILC